MFSLGGCLDIYLSSGGGIWGYIVFFFDLVWSWGVVLEEEGDVLGLFFELFLYLCFLCVCFFIVFKLVVLDEMFYNLDFCDILVLDGDLDSR